MSDTSVGRQFAHRPVMHVAVIRLAGRRRLWPVCFGQTHGSEWPLAFLTMPV